MTETENRECKYCGGSVTHRDFGFIPAQAVVEDSRDSDWKRVYGCTNCGRITLESPSIEETEEAIDEIVEFYEKNDVVSEEEAEQLKR